MEQLSLIPRCDNARGQAGEVGKAEINGTNRSAPATTGQIGQVHGLIKSNPGILSLTITGDHSIPECAARVHDLRAMGFNVITTIHPRVIFRGVERRNVAAYSLGVPEWPAPGYIDGTRGAV